MSRSSSKKQAIIRADGSKAIGMGHLSRACLIGAALEAQGYATTILFRDNTDAKRFLTKRARRCEGLPDDVTLDEEIRAVESLLAVQIPTVFVLDVLNYPDYSEFLGILKERKCATVVIFDDVEKKNIDADIALNGNPCQSEYDYSGYACKYLVGPQYFIMDSGYSSASVRPPRRSVENVLVTLGGSDHHDLLFKTIRAFEGLGDKYHLKIFSTSSTGYVDRLKSELEQTNVPHELFLDSLSLRPFWADCDVAITAGGNTLFERIATRLPGATLCQLELQMRIADAFERMGVNVNLGYGPELDQDMLFERLGRFLTDFDVHEGQYVRSAGVVGGNGLNHLTEAIAAF